MIGTPRLYYDDSLLLRFTARVAAHGVWNGAPSVILDRTAFYPESGGQMADRGSLGGLAVVDVQVDDAGVVHHLLSGAAPAPGTELEAEVERGRRRVHMALHTGQHMLSRALADVARGETVSSRLGETACTIDIDRAEVPERELARAEELVNDLIDDDVPVRAFFPEPGELERLPLRRRPKVETDVRVVQIGDFDVTPCGGTHCARSAQVGLVRITGVERYKGKVRITFAAGRRARAELAGESAVLKALGRELTCGPAEVPAAFEKLRRELTESREALGHARARLAEAAAAELIAAAQARGERRVVAVLDGADVDLLRVVAKRVTADPEAVAFLAARGTDGLLVVVARGASAAFDCGAFFKRVAAQAGGRGGGNRDSAQGRLPAEADWPALVAALAE